jgi:hypothetical protein
VCWPAPCSLNAWTVPVCLNAWAVPVCFNAWAVPVCLNAWAVPVSLTAWAVPVPHRLVWRHCRPPLFHDGGVEVALPTPTEQDEQLVNEIEVVCKMVKGKLRDCFNRRLGSFLIGCLVTCCWVTLDRFRCIVSSHI